MAAGGRPTPFYQRPGFLATAAVVGLLGGIWGVTGAPSPWKIVSDVTSDEVANSNTMIVLDASGAMGQPFGDRTKYGAAAEAVKRFVEPFDHHGYGLRTFGGDCAKAGRRRIDLGPGHNDDVSDIVGEIDPAGKANLVRTLAAAIDDLATLPAGSPKRIVVFTSSGDTCGGSSPDDLRTHLEDIGVKTTFRIVAVKPNARSARRLRRLRQRLGETAELQIAESSDELQTLVSEAQEETETIPSATEPETTPGPDPLPETSTEPPPPEPAPEPEPTPEPQPGPTETVPGG